LLSDLSSVMSKELYPKLLVVSNQCLSQQTSNGRTLRNFLKGWPIEFIAQFCTQFIAPDQTVCSNYCCVSDKHAFKAVLGKKFNPFPSEKEADFVIPSSTLIKTRRNSLTMLIRDLVWRLNRWKSKDVNDWISSFSPQVILFQAGDSPFMFKIARDWSKKFRAPLVIYNSEGYYFKDFDYFRSKGFSHLLYPFFHIFFQREFEKTLRCAKKSIYICDALREDYDAVFHLPSDVIYTATEMTPQNKVNETTSFITSYIGNLGVGRHEGLIDIANALQSISPDLFLDVYGCIPSDQVMNAFEHCPGIRYKGFISYSEVVNTMYNSDLLVHCESFEKKYRMDSKYAFSTKIADSLASGTPFILYAPEEFAVTKYLNENNAAFVATSKEMLKTKISLIYNDVESRYQYVLLSIALVSRNHDNEKNALKFQGILLDVCKE